MTGEKKFRTSMFGYKKKDVYDYVEKLARDLEEQIKVKDGELNNLRNQNKYLITQNDELSGKLKVMEADRTFIAEAIIKAQEKAKMIVEEAINEAEQQKKMLLEQTEEERMKLQLVKQELCELRLSAIDVIKQYEQELAGIVPAQENIQALEEDEAAAAQEEDIE